MTHNRFDGFPIDSFQGKFTGTFDIELEDGLRLGYGDEVVIVLTARVKSASVQESTSGDMRRINALKLLEMKFVHNAERQSQLRSECGFTSPAPAFLQKDLTPVDFSEPDGADVVEEVVVTAEELTADERFGRKEKSDAALEKFVTEPPPRTGHDSTLKRFLEESVG